MWLMRTIHPAAGAEPCAGYVTSAGDGNVNVAAGQEAVDAPMLFPFGFYSLPSIGARAALLPLEGGRLCLGALGHPALRPGEVLIQAGGGTAVRIQADGTILLGAAAVRPDGVIVAKDFVKS